MQQTAVRATHGENQSPYYLLAYCTAFDLAGYYSALRIGHVTAAVRMD